MTTRNRYSHADESFDVNLPCGPDCYRVKDPADADYYCGAGRPWAEHEVGYNVDIDIEYDVDHDTKYGADADGNRGTTVDHLDVNGHTITRLLRYTDDGMVEVDVATLTHDERAALEAAVQSYVDDWQPDPDDLDDEEPPDVDR